MLYTDKNTSEIFKKYNIIVEEGAKFYDNCIIGENSKIYKNAGFDSVVFGSYSYTHSLLIGTVVGNYCSIASKVNTGLFKHPLYRITTSPCTLPESDENCLFHKFTNRKPFPSHKKISIDHDVWIGAGAFIHPGIKISTGSVVGANAVVTHDVPPYAIVAGVPAKIIKYRFDNSIISRLLSTNWFLYDWAGIDIRWGSGVLSALTDIEKYLESQKPPMLNRACKIKKNDDGSFDIGLIHIK